MRADAGPAVAVAQFAPGPDSAANLEVVRGQARDAVDRGADLVLFPEYSSAFLAPPGPELVARAEALDGPFVTGLVALAGELGVHLVAGLVERAGERAANTAVAVDASGIVATYRKLHLYDAFGDRESDWIAPGAIEEPQVFDARGMTCGLQTCYDLRFPEVTRRIVDAGADLVLVPADWVRGPLKEQHWHTLLAARAIENTVFVAAADHVPPTGVGGSTILDPMGVALATLGERPDVAVAHLDPARVAEVRRVNPSLALRRFSVVPRDQTARPAG